MSLNSTNSNPSITKVTTTKVIEIGDGTTVHRANLDRIHTNLDRIHTNLDIIHTNHNNRLTNRMSMLHRVILSIVDVVDKRDIYRLAVVCDWITDI